MKTNPNMFVYSGILSKFIAMMFMQPKPFQNHILES